MARLLTSAQMREADRRTIEELGLPGMVLMENAAAGVERVLWERLPDLRQRRVVVVAGRGNNGGDGFALARRLHQQGVRVRVLLTGRGDQLQGDALTNFRIFCDCGGRVREVTGPEDLEGLDSLLAHAGVVVDAILGTGLTKPVAGWLATLVNMVNAAGKPVLAVDMPSGISADTGQLLGAAIRADWTVTFAAEKIGHRVHPGARYCGEVVTAAIGIPPEYIEIPEHKVFLNSMEGVEIPPRPRDGHKGRFGHLVIFAGGVGKAGAASLTALGALRMGPGLVTVATPHSAQPQVAALLTEAMTIPLGEDAPGVLRSGVAEQLGQWRMKPAALAMGPGLGTSTGVREAVVELLGAFDLPAVLDADALNVLAGQGKLLAELVAGRTQPVVLTPHPGEMARLVEGDIQAVQSYRLSTARRLAGESGAWVVLKGAGTVIASPDGRGWINPTGNSGLAAGGSGDLLTGIIGGLLTQGWPVESAVRAGVWLHGEAADRAVAESGGPAGLLARDLLPHAQRLRNQLG